MGTTVLKRSSQFETPESAQAELTRTLRRRLTDLQCLHEISRLKDEPGLTVPEFLQRIVDAIPPALTHVDLAGAIIERHGIEHRSQNFIRTPFYQKAPLMISGQNQGFLQLCYINERTAEGQSPQHNEQALIETLAREIAKYIERRETEAALRDSERRFADIVNFLPDPTFAINLGGEVIAWNHAMEHLTGTPAAEVLGKDNYEYALPFYQERRPILIDFALHPTPQLRARYPYIDADGATLTTQLFIPTASPEGRYFWIKVARLFNSAGEVIGAIETTRDITEPKRIESDLLAAKRELESEREALRDKNTALREMLAQVDQERRRVILQTQTNIDSMVMPLISSLAAKAPEALRPHVELTRSCLEEVTAPFMRRLEQRFNTLSPRELQICNMIRQGMSCKDIATTLSTSVFTVLNQRQKIRRKLGLDNRKANLVTFLKNADGLPAE